MSPIRALLASAAFAALALVSLSAAQASSEGKRVAVLLGPTQDKYLAAIGKGFEKGATAQGMKVTTFSSPFDPALQAQQIDEAVSQKFDMLVLQPISQKAVVPPLLRAKAAGIPVIFIVVGPEGEEAKDLYLTYTGYDDMVFGRLAGEAMAKKLLDSGKTKAKVIIIAGSMDEGKAPLRQKAFVQALTAHPGMEVLATEDVKWNPVKAETVTGQLLAKFGAQGVDGIYGMNDPIANAVIQAVNAAGLTPGVGPNNLVVVGGNCQGVGIENIKAGAEAATIYDIPGKQGALAAEKAAAYFNGATLEKQYFLPTEAIDASNVEKLAAECTY